MSPEPGCLAFFFFFFNLAGGFMSALHKPACVSAVEEDD